MGTQIFKTTVPIEILLNFLKLISEDKEGFYLLTKIVYKQAEYNNLIIDFINSLKPYYYKSKLYYVERKLDYVKFMTIIRQLCNANHIIYKTQIIYNNSDYEIEYYIMKPQYIFFHSV
jgi:hypothetical protein